MIAELLTRLLQPAPIDEDDARRILDALVAPATSDAERAALLVALEAKKLGEIELAEFARELRRRALPFEEVGRESAIGLCGSGGSLHPSFDVSTLSAFVIAAAGTPVIRNGNRSARQPSGSSDMLEALGLPVMESPEYARESFREHHLAFLPAPLFHPSTMAVVGVRRALGIPTLFNRLGPLSNPAEVRFQLVGTPDVETARLLVGALRRLGARRALAVTSEEGADEFSPASASRLVAWNGSTVTEQIIRSEEYLEADDRRGPWGPLPPPAAALEGRRVLAGGGGAVRGAVLLTGGAALWVSGHARSFRSGIERAQAALDSGAAEELLGRMRELARSRDWRAG